MRKLFIAAFLLTLLFLPACTQTDSKLATAVAQTQAVILIETLEPAATDTLEPTETSTSTPFPTYTATPDLRVINTEPRLIILTLDEIAPIGDYEMYGSVPNYEEFPSVTNPYANLACVLGADAAAEILKKTGLVTGWTTQYHLRTKYSTMPEFIEFTPMVFQSVEGPNLMFEEWGRPCEFYFYEFVENVDFGEKATLCLNKYQVGVNDKPVDLYKYRLAIKYKNIYLGMLAQGLEGTIELDEVYRLVALQMEKLAGLALEEVVTLTQDFGIGVGCTAPPPSDVFNKGSDGSSGWCFPKLENGVKVCWSACLLECPMVSPEGEHVDDSECIPCELGTLKKNTTPIWGN